MKNLGLKITEFLKKKVKQRKILPCDKSSQDDIEFGSKNSVNINTSCTGFVTTLRKRICYTIHTMKN